MKKIASLLLYVLLISGSCFAQAPTTFKPLVSEKFDKLYLSENFDSSDTYWTTLSNSENLILVQDGEYILNRKASVSPYASIGNFNCNLSSYRFVTSLKLEKATTDDGSIGIIFMAQPGGQGGFIFEINKNQQFRLRQIASNAYHYLTGNQKDGGWVKSTLVKGLNIPNLIEVRTSDKNYDIYLNNSLLLSFTEIAYKVGEIGYIIGPGSKGKVDFLYLFTNQKGQEGESNETKKSDVLSPENDVMALAESIITLKTQINKLSEESEDQKQIIQGLKGAEKENEVQKLASDKAIKILESKLKSFQFSFDSLLKVNTELMRYKEMVKGNDGGDLVINLSKNLKAEKLKNEELQKANQALKDSLNQSTSKSTKSKSTIVNPTSNTNSPDSSKKENKSKKDFSLPTGN